MNFLALLACILCFAFSADAQTRKRAPARPAAKSPAEKVKLAEGRYRMSHLPAGQGFEEPWTLWKTNLGYELVEQWVFPAKGLAGPTVIDVNVQMVSELRPIKIHMGDLPRGLDCSVTIVALVCDADGQQSKLAMQGPYDFFSPSPWMLGNIVRRARQLKDDKRVVRLVRVNGSGPEGIVLDAFEAEVQFVGDDQIDVNGRKESASIYELRSGASFPLMLVWVARDGIVYAIQDSQRPEQRLELVDFQRLGKM